MAKSEYEMPIEALLKQFARACAQSGASNSGLVDDPMGSMHAGEVRYLEGVILAVWEGQEPPFRQGDRLKTSPEQPVVPMYPWEHPPAHTIPPATIMTVDRVYYYSKGHGIDREIRWTVTFRGIHWSRKEPQYDPRKFSPVGLVAPLPSR